MNNIYQYSERESRSMTFPALMQKVYLWMTLALAVTGLTAFYVADRKSVV